MGETKHSDGPTPEELAECERRLAEIGLEFLDGMEEPVTEDQSKGVER